MYLLYGTSKLEIENKIKSILKEENITESIHYSLEETDISTVLEDACYIDMFSEKKCIVVEDSYFLTAKETGNIEELLKYINNPNESTILIFTLNEEKLDERKKIVKELKKKAQVFIYNPKETKNLEKILYEYFEKDNYKIEPDALKQLLDRIKNVPNTALNEADKLKLYKVNEKIITKEDITKIVPKQIEDDIFKLVKSILEKDKKETFKIYNDLLKNKKEPVLILGLLASEFRLLLMLKMLLEENKNKYEINEILKEHPYRIEIGIKESAKFKKKDLINYLERLYFIDKSMKTGIGYNTLEMFFLEM